MTLRNIVQIASRPAWALGMLRTGAPSFASLTQYMPSKLNLAGLGGFMDETFSGRLTRDRLASLRDRWKGQLVVKGIASEEDAQVAIELGVDGLIVSNHGGRQLDAGQSSIVPMTQLAEKFGDEITIMLDSGIRSGVDVARAIASGAKFTFLGRSFMYGVAALGEAGGTHTVALLQAQLKQVMEQVGCEQLRDLPTHLVAAD
jgi:L-lactate dehydrogenase (cytochrome)